jgi:hypothetical protein
MTPIASATFWCAEIVTKAGVSPCFARSNSRTVGVFVERSRNPCSSIQLSSRNFER